MPSEARITGPMVCGSADRALWSLGGEALESH